MRVEDLGGGLAKEGTLSKLRNPASYHALYAFLAMLPQPKLCNMKPRGYQHTHLSELFRNASSGRMHTARAITNQHASKVIAAVLLGATNPRIKNPNRTVTVVKLMILMAMSCAEE